MRIALVVNTAWNVVNFRLPLLRALRDDGHEILVLCPEGEQTDTIIRQGFPVKPLHCLERKGQNPFSDIKLVRELAKIYRAERIDLALQYTIKPVIYGSIAAKQSRVLAINTITGLGYAFINDGLTQKIVKRLYRFALARAHRTFFQNEDDLRLFQREKLIDPGKALLVPGSGIDIKKFAYSKLTPKRRSRVLFIGRLLKDKGIYEYVAAADQLRNSMPGLVFAIAGGLDEDNPASASARELAQWTTSDNIEYLGQLPDVREAIIAAGLVVLPSYREGLPRVLLEAGAIGRPIVTTDVPGCRTVVQNGVNGWLVPHKQAGELARAISRAVSLPLEELTQIGLNGRKIVEDQFAVENVVSVYRELIKDLNLD